jgi:hypothetical protein
MIYAIQKRALFIIDSMYSENAQPIYNTIFMSFYKAWERTFQGSILPPLEAVVLPLFQQIDSWRRGFISMFSLFTLLRAPAPLIQNITESKQRSLPLPLPKTMSLLIRYIEEFLGIYTYTLPKEIVYRPSGLTANYGIERGSATDLRRLIQDIHGNDGFPKRDLSIMPREHRIAIPRDTPYHDDGDRARDKYLNDRPYAQGLTKRQWIDSLLGAETIDGLIRYARKEWFDAANISAFLDVYLRE